jgi:cytochrome b pre-mRNA-processing protein 3
VTAARTPSYYLDFGVPDTPEGRFEMIALHLFLRIERAKGVSPNGEDLARAAIEAFVTDMDDCMREMGVGDLTVPKKVKRAAAAFYARAKDYRQALRSDGEAPLAEQLSKHVFGGGKPEAALRLARHIAELNEALAQLPDAAILNAGLSGVSQGGAGTQGEAGTDGKT